MKASSLEENIVIIEKILRELENDSLTMNDALEKYEKGVLCMIRCQELLNKATLRVEQLNQRIAGKNPVNSQEASGD